MQFIKLKLKFILPSYYYGNTYLRYQSESKRVAAVLLYIIYMIHHLVLSAVLFLSPFLNASSSGIACSLKKSVLFVKSRFFNFTQFLMLYNVQSRCKHSWRKSIRHRFTRGVEEDEDKVSSHAGRLEMFRPRPAERCICCPFRRAFESNFMTDVAFCCFSRCSRLSNCNSKRFLFARIV